MKIVFGFLHPIERSQSQFEVFTNRAIAASLVYGLARQSTTYRSGTKLVFESCS